MFKLKKKILMNDFIIAFSFYSLKYVHIACDVLYLLAQKAVAAGAKKIWGGANKLKIRAIWSKLLDPFFSSSERLVNGYFSKDKTEFSFISRYCTCFHIN